MNWWQGILIGVALTLSTLGILIEVGNHRMLRACEERQRKARRLFDAVDEGGRWD